MHYLGRGVLGASGAVAVPAVLLAWLLTWSPDPSVPLWDLPGLLRRLEDNRREREDLDERDEATLCYLAAKRQAARDLAEGRTTLTDAAACFRELDRGWSRFPWETFRRPSPGDSDEERHCREVINWVRTLVEDESEGYLPIVEVLEAELQGRFDRGTLALPSDTPTGPRLPMH
jgi:hypothetical protein